MSLNTTIERKWESDISSFVSMVQDFVTRWKSAYTLETRLRIEAEGIAMFEYILNETKKYEEVNSLSQPNLEDMGFNKTVNRHRVNLAAARINKLSKSYLNYFNSQQTSLMELIGSLKRVRQKKAALDLWDREKAKWVIAEKFLNFDGLNTDLTSQAQCNVGTVEGILTLPIATSKEVNPVAVRITSGNGFIGNSDEDVTTNNIRPEFIFDKNPDTWFEYERLDSGPCQVTITLDLSRATIVNNLSLQAVNLGSGLNFEVEDIIFNSPSRGSVSIENLIGPGLPDNFFTIKTIGNEIWWEISFLPIRCNNISIKLKQENYSFITALSGDTRRVQRKRFAIGLKAASINQIKYAPVGGINSGTNSLMGALYACESSSLGFPRKDTLYRAGLDVSFDNGETWETDIFGLSDGNPPTVKMQGAESSAVWRIELERKEEAFKDATSFTDEEVLLDIETIGRMVSPNQSPVSFHLPKKPANQEVFVLQPKLSRKTSKKREATVIGRSAVVPPALLQSFELPFSLFEKGLEPRDMHIFWHNQEFERIHDIASFDGATEYYWLNEAEDEIFFDTVLSGRGKIKWCFDEERCLFTEKSDGYYHRMETLFDPKKENIRIKNLPAGLERVSIILDVSGLDDTGRMILNENTISDEYSFVGDSTGLTEAPVDWTETDSLSELLNDVTTYSGGGEYYLDTINGILYIHPMVTQELIDNNSTVKLTFTHATSDPIKKSQFRIWHEGIVPTGIIVDKNAVLAIEEEEAVIDTTLPRLNINTGLVETREDNFEDNAYVKILSHRRIIKGSIVVGPQLMMYDSSYPAPTEMDFIDGKTEFLGLFQMDNESTVETTADNYGVVQFKLAAGGAWYEEIGVTFQDEDVFSNSVSSTSSVYSGAAGDYHINSLDGVVTVKVGTDSSASLEGGISYYYSYIDPSFDRTNRFSVNYRKGILYTSEPMWVEGLCGVETGNGYCFIDGVTTEGTELETVCGADYPYDCERIGKGTIKYKVAHYKIAYDIAEEVDSYNYSSGGNNVLINTENLSSVNRRVKIIYGVSAEAETLDDIREFFSPIIYHVSFRFQ